MNKNIGFIFNVIQHIITNSQRRNFEKIIQKLKTDHYEKVTHNNLGISLNYREFLCVREQYTVNWVKGSFVYGTVDQWKNNISRKLWIKLEDPFKSPTGFYTGMHIRAA